MSSRSFPRLLSEKARPLVGLTRSHLLTLGGSYLLLSWVGISGLVSLIFNVALLLILRIAQKQFRPGFFRLLLSPRVLSWAYKLPEEGRDKS